METRRDYTDELGSPPHGRGKVCTCCCASPLARITPAWAGKSAALPSAPSGPRDHPRMGGEKCPAERAGEICAGSPPHGRGKERDCPPVSGFYRITPAWAGKRPAFVVRFNSGIGSPPHGRGKVRSVPLRPGAIRITPAWAGKSLSRYLAAAAGRDHPRMGGEKRYFRRQQFCIQGSPPHGRGKVKCSRVSVPFIRITPAWAGKSC